MEDEKFFLFFLRGFSFFGVKKSKKNFLKNGFPFFYFFEGVFFWNKKNLKKFF